MNLLARCLLLTLALAAPLAAYAKPPAPATTSMLRVVCEGDDAGAEVTVNGKFKGECPLDMQVASGMLQLRVEKKDPSYDRVFEQEIRMGDGGVKKVEAVLSKNLNAAGQQRLREETARREAEQARKSAEFEAQIAVIMIAIPGKSSYELGKTEVTQGQWKAVMGNNPSRHSNCGDTCPVEQVSWNDIQEFLQKLNTKTGKQYRLPTEAEWEYACYGGSQSEYCGGGNLDAVGWYDKNSGDVTHPVGQKQANGYGLYDMSGNVWELMQGCYGKSCVGRAIRGGSWYSYASNMGAAFSSGIDSGSQGFSIGFRVARTLP